MKTDRTFVRATFRVFGNNGKPLPDVTALIGLKPDRHKKIGDLATGGGVPVPQETWSIEEREEVSDEEFAEGAARCLDRLLDRLERAEVSEKLRAAGLASMAELKLGGFCKELRNANVWHNARAAPFAPRAKQARKVADNPSQAGRPAPGKVKGAAPASGGAEL